MEDVVRRVAGALTLSGLAFGGAAVVARENGSGVGAGNTHADAFIVLLVLGLVLMANGFAAFVWAGGLAQERIRGEQPDTPGTDVD